MDRRLSPMGAPEVAVGRTPRSRPTVKGRAPIRTLPAAVDLRETKAGSARSVQNRELVSERDHFQA